MKVYSMISLAVILLACWIETSFCQWSHRKADTELQSKDNLSVDEDTSVIKMALKAAQQALLEEIESLENSIDQQISELQLQKSQVSLKKRTHRKCMVHLISCYKK